MLPSGHIAIVNPSASGIVTMTSQGTAHGRFQRALERRNVRGAEMAAREIGQLGRDL